MRVKLQGSCGKLAFSSFVPPHTALFARVPPALAFLLFVFVFLFFLRAGMVCAKRMDHTFARLSTPRPEPNVSVMFGVGMRLA